MLYQRLSRSISFYNNFHQSGQEFGQNFPADFPRGDPIQTAPRHFSQEVSRIASIMNPLSELRPRLGRQARHSRSRAQFSGSPLSPFARLSNQSSGEVNIPFDIIQSILHQLGFDDEGIHPRVHGCSDCLVRPTASFPQPRGIAGIGIIYMQRTDAALVLLDPIR